MNIKSISILVFLLLFSSFNAHTKTGGVRIKELCRLGGAHDNALVGYGIVTGLAGTGDSSRSMAGLQSISNVLKKFGVQVDATQIRTRNSATVILSGMLPSYVRPGDKIDVNVTSLGDARSLVGGTLLRTHLTASDGKIYALAQGPISVGGFTYDGDGNIVQKNHPTSATIPNGAIIERSVAQEIVEKSGFIKLIIQEPDYTTANRIVTALNNEFKSPVAKAQDAGTVLLTTPSIYTENIVGFISQVESIEVYPDTAAILVINERTGTVVSGGNVTMSKVYITHGNLTVDISREFLVSQPIFVRQTGDGVKTQVVPKTAVNANELSSMSVSLPDGATVNNLVTALNNLKASSRDIITILQAIKRAGALHAKLIIQ